MGLLDWLKPKGSTRPPYSGPPSRDPPPPPPPPAKPKKPKGGR